MNTPLQYLFIAAFRQVRIVCDQRPTEIPIKILYEIRWNSIWYAIQTEALEPIYTYIPCFAPVWGSFIIKILGNLSNFF